MRTFWIIVGLMALAAVGITVFDQPASGSGDAEPVADRFGPIGRDAAIPGAASQPSAARPAEPEPRAEAAGPSEPAEPEPVRTEPIQPELVQSNEVSQTDPQPVVGGTTGPAGNPAGRTPSVEPTEGGPAEVARNELAFPAEEEGDPGLAQADDAEPGTFMPTPESEDANEALGPGDATNSQGGSTGIAEAMFDSIDQVIDAVNGGASAGQDLTEAVTTGDEGTAASASVETEAESVDTTAAVGTATPDGGVGSAAEPAQAQAESPASAQAQAAPAAAVDSFEVAADGTLTIGGRWTVPGKGTPAEPYTLTWDLLQSAQRTYQPRQGLTELPSWTEALDKKIVSLTGFTIPPAAGMSQDELLLMLNQWDGCCIGVPPTPYDAVEVKLREPMGLTADWLGGSAVNHGTVTGRFEVDPYEMNGWLLGLYLIKDARLGAGAPVGSP